MPPNHRVMMSRRDCPALITDACQSRNQGGRPATQHAVAWGLTGTRQSWSHVFTNWLHRGQNTNDTGCQTRRCHNLADLTFIFVMRRHRRTIFAALTCCISAVLSAMAAAMRKPTRAGTAFSVADDRGVASTSAQRTVVATKMNHLRRWLYHQLQQSHKDDKSRSNCQKCFGHQSKF